MTEHEPGATRDIDWDAAYRGEVPASPVDRDLMDLAAGLEPGRALDLGCGAGQNSIWLAQRGWRVHGVDIAGGAIERADAAAARAGVEVSFQTADVTTWRTSERCELVISTYALPPRGPGRMHALTTARDAVTPGGTMLVAEFDASLAGSGWMAEEQLVTLEEVIEMLPGFELERAEVRVSEHRHGQESQDLPVVIVAARHPGSATVGA